MTSLRLILVSLSALYLSIPIFAGDHASKYQVGTFLSTVRADDGSYALSQCSGFGCSATGYHASHSQHQIETPEGVYTVNAPISVGGTLLVGMLTPGGLAPTIHKGWFMDDLREGQSVLFYPDCNKRHVCRFWLPNPDKVGKEILTTGWFEPAIAKTNTDTLCGTGKLSLSVANQVCAQTGRIAPPAGPLPAVPVASMPVFATAAPPPATVTTGGMPPVIAADRDAVPPQASEPTDPKEIDRLVKAGEASRGVVLTVPPNAEISIDGKRVGLSPYSFVLTKNGDSPHTITIVKDGYAKIEKNVVPNGTTIEMELILERDQQSD